MQTDQEKDKTKQPYEKPVLRTIELAAEEVLGLGCKLLSSGLAYGAVPCVNANNCSLVGT